MTTARFIDFLGQGLAAARPVAATLAASLPTGSTAMYHAYDTDVVSYLNVDTPAWLELDIGALNALGFQHLADVDWTTPPTDGQIFAWDNGAGFLVPVTPFSNSDADARIAAASIGDLDDVDLSTPATDGQALFWNNVSGKFEPGDVPAGYDDTDADARIAAASIGDLSDVDITTDPVGVGESLIWDGTNFVPGASSSVTELDDLTDVDTTTAAPTTGQALIYDGANFVPDDLPVGGPATNGTFQAYLSTTPTNVTGDGTDYTIPFNTTATAQAFATLNTSTGAITINHAGSYLISAMCRLSGGTTSDSVTLRIRKNGTTVWLGVVNASNEAAFTANTACVLDLAATDVITIASIVSGGSLNVGPAGGSVNDNTVRITQFATTSAAGITESGAAFPGSPVDRQRFFHTGYDREFFWDAANSLWLSTIEYEAYIPLDEAVNSTKTASDSTYGAWFNVWKGQHQLRITGWRHGTGLSGTGNWSIRIRDNSSTILATATITASSYPSKAAVNTTWNNEYVVGDLLENSGTASITSCFIAFTYRLIGT